MAWPGLRLNPALSSMASWLASASTAAAWRRCATAIAAKTAAALADLHRQNVIHHDIKPSSVMFRPSGEALLIDFGLWHHSQLPDLLQEEFRLAYGTAPYMAPERLLGVRDDPRSDLFSLGVLLYFFTTGMRRSARAKRCGECGGGYGAIRFRRASREQDPISRRSRRPVRSWRNRQVSGRSGTIVVTHEILTDRY
jgi:serine/threonine protein kinase